MLHPSDSKPRPTAETLGLAFPQKTRLALPSPCPHPAACISKPYQHNQNLATSSTPFATQPTASQLHTLSKTALAWPCICIFTVITKPLTNSTLSCLCPFQFLLTLPCQHSRQTSHFQLTQETGLLGILSNCKCCTKANSRAFGHFLPVITKPTATNHTPLALHHHNLTNTTNSPLAISCNQSNF